MKFKSLTMALRTQAKPGPRSIQAQRPRARGSLAQSGVLTLSTWITAAALFAALALPVQLAAQHTRYKLVDLGTFGGPNAVQNSPGRAVNSLGAAIGGADLPIPDPYAPNCLQFCFVNHAFVWQRGVLNALGFPAGVDSTMNSSFPTWITDAGLVAGLSENGLIDPLTGFPQVQAVLWNKRRNRNQLGRLGRK